MKGFPECMLNRLGRLMFPDACSAHRYYLTAVQLSRVHRLHPTAIANCRTFTATGMPKNTGVVFWLWQWTIRCLDGWFRLFGTVLRVSVVWFSILGFHPSDPGSNPGRGIAYQSQLTNDGWRAHYFVFLTGYVSGYISSTALLHQDLVC